VLPLPTLINVVIRWFQAVAIGVVRSARQPPRIKTPGLVSLDACLIALAAMGFTTESHSSGADMSRAIQSIVTGSGFLGAG
jgi:uncharacterized membrane protein YhiD involved in acid resistance